MFKISFSNISSGQKNGEGKGFKIFNVFFSFIGRWSMTDCIRQILFLYLSMSYSWFYFDCSFLGKKKNSYREFFLSSLLFFSLRNVRQRLFLSYIIFYDLFFFKKRIFFFSLEVSFSNSPLRDEILRHINRRKERR